MRTCVAQKDQCHMPKNISRSDAFEIRMIILCVCTIETVDYLEMCNHN